MSMSNIEKVAKVLKDNNTFFIASHAHPDGDAIGATLALGELLRSMGKQVVMYNEDGVPENLDFLRDASMVVSEIDSYQSYDVSILLDCCEVDRAGRDFPSEERRGQLICIDHHAKDGIDADLVCQDQGAAATGQILFEIFKAMKVEITAEMAQNLMLAIIIDTGFFRYSNTTAEVFKMAAELVEAGASTSVISQALEERVSPKQLNLLTKSIETIEYLHDGSVAVMTLTNQMFKEADANVSMAEDFINYPRSIDGVKIAVLIREKGRDEYKISFRSKGAIDVAKLASHFDGGGHTKAAGCTLHGSLGSVKQRIVKAVIQAIDSEK